MKLLINIALLTGACTAFNAQAAPLADWMNTVSDDTQLTAMTIPGTHDSGATHEPLPGIAKTQNTTIAQQLDNGVRYLDIRLRHYQDSLLVHHGSIYQHLNFDDVMQQVTDFLNLHPSETVLMQVKEEYDATGNTHSFEQTFVDYKNRPAYRNFWWGHSYLPTMGQARGKIVLLRRFAGSFYTSGGIDMTYWEDNTSFNTQESKGVKIHVQDSYKVKSSTNNNKWSVIKQNLDNAAQSPGVLTLNFSSGYSPTLGIPNIPKVSNDINQRLLNYFNERKGQKQSHGVIISDFSSAALSQAELKAYLP
ncbi:phosphatidylinositol-specific phospholipase C [Vibrio palustris]|uniref:1-phosphatidylinositol phosphodiesterase n=1 Tax=Vibrio palustris TaxID=1918946 RepID=A0A1R4B8F7_9VIBR|nr:phosphatidylinositol-specific phospholipase C [Vibrio palustris]SJL85186.1 1-phosphatidylinositol phosphodiesterase precursor [Vibrio palustris]